MGTIQNTVNAAMGTGTVAMSITGASDLIRGKREYNNLEAAYNHALTQAAHSADSDAAQAIVNANYQRMSAAWIDKYGSDEDRRWKMANDLRKSSATSSFDTAMNHLGENQQVRNIIAAAKANLGSGFHTNDELLSEIKKMGGNS